MTAETKFLTALFDGLNSLDYRYAVMRNGELLPYSLGESDLDIIGDDSGLASFVAVAKNAAEKNGGKTIVEASAPHIRQLMFVGEMDGQWWGACVDFVDGMYCKGNISLVAGNLLDSRKKLPSGVWQLDESVGKGVAFAKDLIIGCRFNEKYICGVDSLFGSNGGCTLFNKNFTSTVYWSLKNRTNIGKCRRLSCFLREALRHPFNFILGKMTYVVSLMCRYIRPRGRMIVVLGTDGSGKSTLLNAMLPVLNAACHNQIIIHHLKPDLIPALGRLRGVKYKPGMVCTTPHASKPSGLIGSIIRITYLTIDYVFGYWVKVRQHIAKIPTGIWIFDRYAYDMLLDPRRFRINLPHWIIKVYLMFIPKPDLILCLGGDPEKIYARKPETSLKEVTRQIVALKDFCENNKCAVWIDTTGDVEESKNAALTAIVQMMSKRYK